MNDASTSTLSIVMPAHNEAQAIEDAVRDLQTHVLGLIPDCEVIVVDDGSTDGTGDRLDRLAAAEPRLRVIHQSRGGHGRALRTGMDAARGNYLFLLDSDRQIPLDAFPSLWEAARQRDGAFGVRKKRHDPRLRLLLSALIRTALRLLFRTALQDANVPFKLFRRRIWLDARELMPEDTLAPSLFLAVYVRCRGSDITELPVPHRVRQTGTGSLRYWRLLKFCLRAFRQMLQFRRRLAE
jgi:glycosyltransferase involved in cell wall biosynthesis